MAELWSEKSRRMERENRARAVARERSRRQRERRRRVDLVRHPVRSALKHWGF
jgi:hypothetical protein